MKNYDVEFPPLPAKPKRRQIRKKKMPIDDGLTEAERKHQREYDRILKREASPLYSQYWPSRKLTKRNQDD